MPVAGATLKLPVNPDGSTWTFTLWTPLVSDGGALGTTFLLAPGAKICAM